MAKKNNKEELVYASPILIPLGALAKGSGQCTAGSSVVPNDGDDDGGNGDGNGGGDGGTGACINTGTDCTAGMTATNDCTAGPTACRDCSAGTAAVRDCTAGTAATSGCTAGSGL